MCVGILYFVKGLVLRSVLRIDGVVFYGNWFIEIFCMCSVFVIMNFFVISFLLFCKMSVLLFWFVVVVMIGCARTTRRRVTVNFYGTRFFFFGVRILVLFLKFLGVCVCLFCGVFDGFYVCCGVFNILCVMLYS